MVTAIPKGKTPAQLLAEIKRDIAHGKIVTWAFDEDGDLTHDTDQWRFRGWMRPRILGTSLLFYFVCSKRDPNERETYAVYHGRLIEMLLAHFDQSLTAVWPSPLGEPGDVIQRTASV